MKTLLHIVCRRHDHRREPRIGVVVNPATGIRGMNDPVAQANKRPEALAFGEGRCRW